MPTLDLLPTEAEVVTMLGDLLEPDDRYHVEARGPFLTVLIVSTSTGTLLENHLNRSSVWTRLEVTPPSELRLRGGRETRRHFAREIRVS